MKRFTFRLDSLRRLAAADESLQQIEVSKREHALSSAVDRVRASEALVTGARARLQSLIDTGTPASSAVSLAIREMDDARLLASREQDNVEACRAAADTARAVLADHVMRRRMLERLERRARRDHAREAERLDQRDMDESATQVRGEVRG